MTKADSNVDRIYDTLRRMAADFVFKPDERINESALSVKLGASRTPLREALNRLVAQGFLTLKPGRGFFCRPLSPKRILDLYEARVAVETEITRLACARASDQDLARLKTYLDQSEPTYDNESDPVTLLAMDEAFHLNIADVSQNSELVLLLKNLNDRVRYIRLIDLNSLRQNNPIATHNAAKLSAHRKILNALLARDETTATTLMRRHIERRSEEATKAVQIAYAQLYVPTE